MKVKLLASVGFLFLAVITAATTSAAPSSGNITVAFIMVGFEDQDFQDEYDQDYFEDIAFADSDSMRDYFDEVSKGKLNIEGEVFGPYTLDGDAAEYSSGSSFVRDSVEIADDDIYFPDFDAVMAIHSGPGGESSGDSNDIWSAHWPSITINTNDDDEDGNDHVIRRISQVPEYQLSNGERNPLGVWCHEFGHELGLPDYYDTDGSSEGVGNWAVMAAGSWGNNGETPVYFSAYSRYWLGWDEPITVEDDVTNLVIEPVSEGGNIYKLPIPGNWSNSEQYFLLENRQQTRYDTYLPGEGLLIWHIDEEIMFSKWSSNTVNNDEDHKGMDLEEADGNDDLDSGANRGDNGDPYRSGSFTKDTYPNSLAYNGSESGWKIDNIEVDGDNIILDISFLSKPHAIADADDAVVTEGEILQFYGNESWDEDGVIVNYTWNFGDGKYNYTANPKHIFTENGEYNVTLTVRDNNGLVDSYVLNIFVNKPPIANVVISKISVMLGESITFDASNSYDLDGEIDFYYWNFDDGRTSNQMIKEHTYSNSGIFNVSLKLIDNLNDISTTYYLIEVINSLPKVNFTINPETGNTLTMFEFNDLSFDSDGDIEEWLWNFGDGNSSTEE
ncbi:MAG: M6 family metalloprotease domain-containing protein, partial [Candidatus Thermoplasmatota archaeon]|nr:M6 family metalloprotease domain-containing protein [Candidatus Thermoplasmatota archaeon]